MYIYTYIYIYMYMYMYSWPTLLWFGSIPLRGMGSSSQHQAWKITLLKNQDFHFHQNRAWSGTQIQYELKPGHVQFPPHRQSPFTFLKSQYARHNHQIFGIWQCCMSPQPVVEHLIFDKPAFQIPTKLHIVGHTNTFFVENGQAQYPQHRACTTTFSTHHHFRYRSNPT